MLTAANFSAGSSSPAKRLGRRCRREAPGGLLSLLLTWQTRATERRALRELDDRLLADVGLTRAQACAEAAKSFWEA